MIVCWCFNRNREIVKEKTKLNTNTGQAIPVPRIRTEPGHNFRGEGVDTRRFFLQELLTLVMVKLLGLHCLARFDLKYWCHCN